MSTHTHLERSNFVVKIITKYIGYKDIPTRDDQTTAKELKGNIVIYECLYKLMIVLTEKTGKPNLSDCSYIFPAAKNIVLNMIWEQKRHATQRCGKACSRVNLKLYYNIVWSAKIRAFIQRIVRTNTQMGELRCQ